MPSLRADLAALLQGPRDLWILYAVKLMESVAYFTVYTLLAIFLSADLGYSDTEAGSITGTWLTAVSLVVFGAGFVADGLGIKKALLIAAISAAVGRGLVALAGTPEAVFVGLAASVWGIASMKPTMNAAVRAYTTPATVAFGFSLYYVVMNIGAVTQGPLISGFRKWFADGATVMGHDLSSSQLVFLVGFVVSVINIGLVSLLRDPPRTDVAPGATQTSNPLKIAKEVLSVRTFWTFLAFVALLTFVRLIFQHAHLTWPKYTIREFGEEFPFATYWAINPAMIIFLTPVATALTRHLPPFPVIVVGAFLSAVSVFAMAFSTTVAASVLFIVILSIGEALWSPRLYEYTATIAPPGRESSYMGLSEIPLFFAKPVVGFLSGWLLTRYCPPEGARDSTQMWLIIGIMTIAAPVLMILLRKFLVAKPSAQGASEAVA